MKRSMYVDYNTAAKLLKLKTASFILKYIKPGLLKSVYIARQPNRPMILRSEVLKLKR